MHFSTKNYLKSNRYHTVKHLLIITRYHPLFSIFTLRLTVRVSSQFFKKEEFLEN